MLSSQLCLDSQMIPSVQVFPLNFVCNWCLTNINCDQGSPDLKKISAYKALVVSVAPLHNNQRDPPPLSTATFPHLIAMELSRVNSPSLQTAVM